MAMRHLARRSPVSPRAVRTLWHAARPPRFVSKQRIIAVVGMHRSGTSSLAGTLEEAGLYLGDVLTSSPHNRKGNRENRRIRDLNEAVLVGSGGAWHRPPERLRWTRAHRARRNEIIRGYEGVRRWGFKDPRTLLTLAFWEEALGELELVGTFRHPLLVAESLERRNGGSLDAWLDLWLAYNERLVDLRRARAFPILEFRADVRGYETDLVRVLDLLRLPLPERLDFFDPGLRHVAAERSAPLPPAVRSLYERLSALSL